MGLKEPFERLRRDLLRRGLPAGYVSRTVQELSDHHADLSAAEPATGDSATGDAWSRLGDVKCLGKDLAREFHRRSFPGRHPLLTFVVAPLPVLLVLWTAMWCIGLPLLFGVLMPLLGWRAGQTVAEMRPVVLWMLLSWHYGMLLVPPTLAALWFCRLAARSGRGFAWATPACILVALVALTFVFDLQLPYAANQGRLMIGFGLPLPESWRSPQIMGFWQVLRPERQVLQTLCPLAVLAYAIWKTARSRSACLPAMTES